MRVLAVRALAAHAAEEATRGVGRQRAYGSPDSGDSLTLVSPPLALDRPGRGKVPGWTGPALC